MICENGWPASTNPNSLGADRFDVAGTTRGFTVRSDVGPLLMHAAYRIHREVARIDVGTWDEWGWAPPKKIPGTDKFSNHGGAVAIDVNSVLWQWKEHDMSAAQVRKCKRIEASFGGVIRWGGSYRSTVDQMHWEIAPGVTRARALAQIKKMRLRADGSVKPKPGRYTLKRTLGVGSVGLDVLRLRLRLGMVPLTKFGPETKKNVKKFQAKKGLHQDGVVGPATAHALGWGFRP